MTTASFGLVNHGIVTQVKEIYRISILKRFIESDITPVSGHNNARGSMDDLRLFP